MRKVILAAVVFSAIAPAAFAGDKVVLSRNGSDQRIDVGDLKTMTVCALKEKAARTFGLDKKKFSLKKGGGTLSDSKSLYDAGVHNQNKVLVEDVSYSTQC